MTETEAVPLEMREALAGFLHAVRNPLAVIRSTAQVTQRVSAGSQAVTSYMNSIVGQVDRIELALQGLLRLSTLEAPPPAKVSLLRSVSQVVPRLRDTATGRGVALGVALGPDWQVRMSAERLEMALAELLDNAIRYAPPGSRVEVSWEGEGSRLVLLHVDDQGEGVAREHAESVLRAFFSTDRSRLGLGLALAERVCRQAGGEVRWQNRTAGGCRFTLALPVASL